MSEQTLAARPASERVRDWFVRNAPGVLISVTVGMAATFISNVYGGPTVLFALLLGMSARAITIQ